VFVGIELGQWLNYQMGYLDDSSVIFPLSFDFSNLMALGIRTVIGLAVVGASEYVGKFISYTSLCAFYGVDGATLKKTPNAVDNTKKNFIDLTSKFLTYSFLGFTTLFFVPHVLRYFNVQRGSFYTEI
jgi:hypothetical protein